MSILQRRRELMLMKKASQILPAEYQQCEYVEATGTQIIPTEFYPVINDGAEMSLKLAFTNLTGIQIVLSSLFAYANSQFQFPTNGTSIYYQAANTQAMDSRTKFGELSVNTKHEIVLSNRAVALVGQESLAKTTANAYINVTKPITLFGQNSSETGTRAKAKIYEFWYKENGEYSCWLIPCYRKTDGEPGVYDVANDIFYTNTGTGDLILGAEV